MSLLLIAPRSKYHLAHVDLPPSSGRASGGRTCERPLMCFGAPATFLQLDRISAFHPLLKFKPGHYPPSIVSLIHSAAAHRSGRQARGSEYGSGCGSSRRCRRRENDAQLPWSCNSPGSRVILPSDFVPGAIVPKIPVSIMLAILVGSLVSSPTSHADEFSACLRARENRTLLRRHSSFSASKAA